MTVDVTVKVIPWDDPEFVRAFETAAAATRSTGLALNTADGALAIQRELRANGFPNATCYCERTVDEALARRTRCVVTRDGQTAPLGFAPAG
ncbi:MAG TPA: hypothetical protein VH813_02130 [Candidatus Limnocylindrales bacterium]|jgi:hypothetical protein